MGADFETIHEFKSGDTISADMMNELFENIKLSKTVILSSDLVGTWSCKVSVSYSNTHDPGWTDDSDNLSSTLISELTFSADGDGTYSYQSSAPNPFYTHDDRAIASGYKYIVTSNSFYAKIPRKNNAEQGGEIQPDGKIVYSLSKISKNSYVFLKLTIESGYNPDSLICDKLNLPPNSPSSLTYALPADNTSSSITLTWTDSQTEAVTGYKVNRKTVDTDNFTTVSTITDNSTRTYADDNVTESGKYWYRVLAYNTNGDGTPSKVVKAEFPDDEAPSGSLKIDNGSAYTTSSIVGLNLSATDNKGVVGYLATESNAPPSTTSSGWTSVTSTKTYSADNVAFTLSSGYGTKLVFVWYKDGKGNQSGYGASIKYKDATLDEQAPTGSLTIDNATSSTTSTSVTLNMTAKDNVGVVAYMTSESSVPPSPSSSDWVSITSATSYSTNVSFTLSTGYGVKFVYVWLKDAEGNIAGYGASITYSSQ